MIKLQFTLFVFLCGIVLILSANMKSRNLDESNDRSVEKNEIEERSNIESDNDNNENNLFGEIKNIENDEDKSEQDLGKELIKEIVENEDLATQEMISEKETENINYSTSDTITNSEVIKEIEEKAEKKLFEEKLEEKVEEKLVKEKVEEKLVEDKVEEKLVEDKVEEKLVEENTEEENAKEKIKELNEEKNQFEEKEKSEKNFKSKHPNNEEDKQILTVNSAIYENSEETKTIIKEEAEKQETKIEENVINENNIHQESKNSDDVIVDQRTIDETNIQNDNHKEFIQPEEIHILKENEKITNPEETAKPTKPKSKGKPPLPKMNKKQKIEGKKSMERQDEESKKEKESSSSPLIDKEINNVAPIDNKLEHIHETIKTKEEINDSEEVKLITQNVNDQPKEPVSNSNTDQPSPTFYEKYFSKDGVLCQYFNLFLVNLGKAHKQIQIYVIYPYDLLLFLLFGFYLGKLLRCFGGSHKKSANLVDDADSIVKNLDKKFKELSTSLMKSVVNVKPTTEGSVKTNTLTEKDKMMIINKIRDADNYISKIKDDLTKGKIKYNHHF